MEVTDTDDAWESMKSGVEVQFGEHEVAITAAKHVGHNIYATFTPFEFSMLEDAVVNEPELAIDGLRVEEAEHASIRVCFDHGSGAHIVTLTESVMERIRDEWDKQRSGDTDADERDFVTYLQEQEYLLGVTDVNPHATDGGAAVSYHSCLTPDEMRGLIEDDNVTVEQVDFEEKHVKVLDER